MSGTVKVDFVSVCGRAWVYVCVCTGCHLYKFIGGDFQLASSHGYPTYVCMYVWALAAEWKSEVSATFTQISSYTYKYLPSLERFRTHFPNFLASIRKF